MRYLVCRLSEYVDKYVVEACSVAEAKEKVLSGTEELHETEFSHADTDSNNFEVYFLDQEEENSVQNSN
jgi:hypothetical protein